ncbi:MAG: hypothetical protein ABIH01_04250, partial [Candidatus Omnitrophota bacterium]
MNKRTAALLLIAVATCFLVVFITLPLGIPVHNIKLKLQKKSYLEVKTVRITYNPWDILTGKLIFDCQLKEPSLSGKIAGSIPLNALAEGEKINFTHGWVRVQLSGRKIIIHWAEGYKQGESLSCYGYIQKKNLSLHITMVSKKMAIVDFTEPKTSPEEADKAHTLFIRVYGNPESPNIKF